MKVSLWMNGDEEESLSFENKGTKHMRWKGSLLCQVIINRCVSIISLFSALVFSEFLSMLSSRLCWGFFFLVCLVVSRLSLVNSKLWAFILFTFINRIKGHSFNTLQSDISLVTVEWRGQGVGGFSWSVNIPNYTKTKLNKQLNIPEGLHLIDSSFYNFWQS